VSENSDIETEQSSYGLKTREQAESIQALTERGLKLRGQLGSYSFRIVERSDGLFDLIVSKRVN
jgi:hypothetical protein